MISVHPVSTKHDWKLFFDFPNRLYTDNPYYVPTLLLDEKWNFNPKKNPALEVQKTHISGEQTAQATTYLIVSV